MQLDSRLPSGLYLRIKRCMHGYQWVSVGEHAESRIEADVEESGEGTCCEDDAVAAFWQVTTYSMQRYFKWK